MAHVLKDKDIYKLAADLRVDFDTQCVNSSLWDYLSNDIGSASPALAPQAYIPSLFVASDYFNGFTEVVYYLEADEDGVPKAVLVRAQCAMLVQLSPYARAPHARAARRALPLSSLRAEPSRRAAAGRGTRSRTRCGSG